MADKERPRRSTGQAKDPAGERLPDGRPDMRPTAGYAGNEPVQYSDETDAQFKARQADFELRRLHAEQIEAGGATPEQRKEEVRLESEAKIAAIDAQEATRPKPHVPA